MALSEDQIDQASRLHNAVAWVYPDLSDAQFWDNYFNQTEPQLTPEEQASGISIGPAPTGSSSGRGRRTGTSSTTQQQNNQPVTQPGVDLLRFRDLPPVTFSSSSNYSSRPQMVGANSWREPGIGRTSYQSALIKSLREQSGLGSNNPGVNLLPNSAMSYDSNQSVLTNNLGSTDQDTPNVIFDPQVFSYQPGVVENVKMKAATPIQTQPASSNYLYDFSDYYDGGGIGSGAPGSSNVGQGVNDTAASIGLGLMSYGSNVFAPGGLAASAIGNAIAGSQADAMGNAANALSSYDVPGIAVASDKNGNVYGVSNLDTIAAADAAIFGGALSNSGAATDSGSVNGVAGELGLDGGGNGGSGCVIATHAVANGQFTPREKRRAVQWCVKNLHNTWWGEAIRRGYRFYGRKAIDAGKAQKHYQEFRDYVAFATGSKKTPKTAFTFAWRNVQFFVTGLFVKA